MSDFNATLGTFEIGSGTDYGIRSISGLGTPQARTKDSERGDRDGDVGGADVLQRRIISLVLKVGGDDPEDFMENLDTLKQACAPTATDVVFEVDMPGFERFLFVRPRGVDAGDLTTWQFSWAWVQVNLEALDPLSYGDEVTESAASSITVTNTGTYVTDRVELTVAASGTPTITGENGSIVFADSFSGTRVINLRDRTVTDGSGTDCYPEVAASSTWFTVLPGANTIATSTGTVAATFRPAYL